MNEIERAANPTTEEAIKYLEGMIFTQDFSPATLRAVAVNTMAIEALREQAERSRGCDHCRGWDSRCGANYCPMCGRELGKRLEAEP